MDIELKKANANFSEHDLIKIVNICKKTKFQNPNTDHLSPIGQEILTIGMMSEYTIVSNKNSDNLPSGTSNHDRALTDQAKKAGNYNSDEKNISSISKTKTTI